MGKSNKFDYTNRASTGLKLGHIIGRDLEKEVEKVARDVDRQVAKARKTSSSSSASGISGVDHPDAVRHPLDIKVPGKQLGDDGACAMAASLTRALQGAANGPALRLEDLNLCGNAITTVTLASLAPAIALAVYDLKTLDLAGNDIKVETEAEAVQWEIFLRSFQKCYKLRRLDLSGNVKLGARALEILARVHIHELHIEPMCSRGDDFSVHSLASDHGEDNDDDDSDTPVVSYFADSMTSGKYLQRRCGLRGIPFMTFTNIGLTDAGALWLSYVLEDHHYPNQLIDDLNAISPDSNIKAYQQETSSQGVDYEEREPDLGKDGLQLLKKTESVRRQAMLDDASTASHSVLNLAGQDDDAPALRRSVDGGPPRALAGDRRASIRSIRTVDGGEHELSELESARKKLQRSIIANHGGASVELWRAGLRMANSATVLAGLVPSDTDQPRYYTGPPQFRFTSAPSPPSRPVTPGDEPISEGRTSIDSARSSPTASPGPASYAHTLAITEVTNSPVPPRVLLKPHRKHASSESGDVPAVTPKLEHHRLVRDHDPSRFVHFQEARIACAPAAAGVPAFRDHTSVGQLPPGILLRIAELTVTARERAMLSGRQRRRIVDWALDRANFAVRMSWRKLADSAQVWTFLESIECLAYERE